MTKTVNALLAVALAAALAGPADAQDYQDMTDRIETIKAGACRGDVKLNSSGALEAMAHSIKTYGPRKSALPIAMAMGQAETQRCRAAIAYSLPNLRSGDGYLENKKTRGKPGSDCRGNIWN